MEKKPKFLKGDQVVMFNCGEADFYKDRVWICRTDSFLEKYGLHSEVVFLEGFGGYFLCKFLHKSVLTPLEIKA